MWSSLQHLWFLISLPEVAIWPLIFGTRKTFQQEPPQVRLWLKSRRSQFCLPGKVIHELDKALSSAWAWTTESSPRLQTPWRGLDDPFPWVCFSRNRGSWYMGFHGGEDLQYFGCTERFSLLWLIRLLGLYFSEVINAGVMPGSSLSNSQLRVQIPPVVSWLFVELSRRAVVLHLASRAKGGCFGGDDGFSYLRSIMSYIISWDSSA